VKVKDLIAALSAYDPEMDVVMSVNSDGSETADDIDVPATARIIRNQSPSDEYWRGRHDFVRFWNRDQDAGNEVVVIVPKAK
jgi:hypothetical protein